MLLLRRSAGGCARTASSLLSCCAPRTPAMPLRAKILHPGFHQQTMSASSSAPTSASTIRQESGEVLFNSTYGVRTIELNRPKALNALNKQMVDEITPRMLEWEKSQLAQVVVVKGAGDRAFCAGGDVKSLAEANKTGEEGQAASTAFFGAEYRLNHLIATYSKPYVAFMDGITMGGGVGLSVHAPFRIATERTLFSMPETTIGFYPDVGGSFFLPRLDGKLGTYLALTSERLEGVHAFYGGIATHYMHSSNLPDLEQRLAELTFADGASLRERTNIVNATIEEFVTGLPDNEPFKLAGEKRLAIDRCFVYTTIDEITEALEKENSEWAQKTLETLKARSPTSVRVALQQMQMGANWSITETFQREAHIAAKFMKHPDFVEGVLAQLSKPRRTPTWAAVPDNVEEFFAFESGEAPMELLKAADYRQYPWAELGLPSEHKIKQVIDSDQWTHRDAVQHFVDEYKGKLGVRQKVDEVLERMTVKAESGFIKWKSVILDAPAVAV